MFMLISLLMLMTQLMTLLVFVVKINLKINRFLLIDDQVDCQVIISIKQSINKFQSQTCTLLILLICLNIHNIDLFTCYDDTKKPTSIYLQSLNIEIKRIYILKISICYPNNVILSPEPPPIQYNISFRVLACTAEISLRRRQRSTRSAIWEWIYDQILCLLTV